MTKSRLQATIDKYRQALIAQEESALASLEAAHQHTLYILEPALQRLYDQIDQAKKKGEQLSPSWLYESKRLETIKTMIEGQIDQYGALARETTARLQRGGVLLGQDAAQALLQAQKPPGVNWSFGVPSQEAIARLVGATQTGSPLADLFAGFGFGVGKDVANALVTGLTLGNNPRQIAPTIRDALEVPRYRALAIARTESIRAYRGANLETFRANADVVQYWRWTAALQVRTCPACLAMDGTLHLLNEDMGSHPNCRCSPVPDTKSWAEILEPFGIKNAGSIPESRPALQTGADWFDKQSDHVKELILGPSKFKAYKEGKIRLKDTVARSRDPDWGRSIQVKSLKQILIEKAATAREPAPPAPPPKDARLVAIETELGERYPDTLFNFRDMHPEAAAAIRGQIIKMFDAYPDVGRSIAYIGTGEGCPPGYEVDWKEERAYALVKSVRSRSEVYATMFFNPELWSDPDLFRRLKARDKTTGWGASDYTFEATFTHEFGHVVNFFLEQNGQGKTPPGLGFIGRTGYEGEVAQIITRFMSKHKKLGDNVSGYAKSGGPVEAFAEAFASMNRKGIGTNKKYTRLLKSLLKDLLPDGSAASWSEPQPAKMSEENWDTWDAFRKKYELD